jgi:mRNA interferase RelE/StbE
MDKLTKALKKLSTKERKHLKTILFKIKSGDLTNVDITKLKGHDNIYRVRVGSYRVIFIKQKTDIKILSLERRNDNTYNL